MATQTAVETPKVKVARFLEVDLADLKESEKNPRKSWDADELKGLADTIRQDGVLEPLLVREVPNGKGPSYEIVAGARRFRAAKLAGLKKVPVSVQDLDDSAALRIMVLENLQRKNLTPLEEAEGFKTLIEETKFDIKQLAVKIGKSISYVYAKLKILELSAPCRKALETRAIEQGHAVIISRLDPALQVETLKDVQHRGMSVRDLEEYVQREVHRSLASVPWKPEDATLVPKAGSCLACPHRSMKDTHPDLKPNTCLRPECYESKLLAVAQRKANEEAAKVAKELAGIKKKDALPKKGEKAVKIKKDVELLPGSSLKLYDALEYGRQPEKGAAYRTIASDSKASIWAIADKQPCPSSVLGVIMDDRGVWDGESKRIKYGTFVKACVDASCEIHHPKTESGREKKPAKQLLAERKKREAEQWRKTVRRAVLERTLSRIAKADWMDLRQDLERVAIGSFNRLWDNYKGPVFSRRGWEPKKATNYGGRDYETPLREKMRKLDDGELMAFLVEISVAQYMDGPDYEKRDGLMELAKEHKVDARKVEKELREKLKTAVKTAVKTVVAKKTKKTKKAKKAKKKTGKK